MRINELFDCIFLIEEKLDEAVRNPESQKGAITEASGVMAAIREIVEADNLTKTFPALVCDEFIREEWQPWWDEFATLDRETFLERAYWLRVGINGFRSALEKQIARGGGT